MRERRETQVRKRERWRESEREGRVREREKERGGERVRCEMRKKWRLPCLRW